MTSLPGRPLVRRNKNRRGLITARAKGWMKKASEREKKRKKRLEGVYAQLT